MRSIFALLLLSGLAFAQSDGLAAKSQEAKRLMTAGRFAEAAAVYEELVRAMPGNPGLLLNLGMAQHMAGRDREAIRQFEKVLKAQPKALPAWMLMGASYMRLGEPARAVAPLRKGLALSPGDKQAQQMLIDALLMLARFDEAAAELEKAVAAGPGNARLNYALGRAYEALAQRSFAQLQKLAPDSSYVMVLVGETQLSRGRNASAFQLFREALRRDATIHGAHAGLAHVYRKTGHAEWAATAEARERQLTAAACGEGQSRVDSGRAVSRSKPEAAPREPATRIACECHVAAGRLRQAESAAGAGKTPPALFCLTRVYNSLAARTFAKLDELAPSVELHQVRAEVYRNSARHADSIREWEAALKLDPGNAQLERELAVAVYLSREYTRAEPLLREQLDKQPGSAELHFFLGDTLLNQQQHEAAIAELRRALVLAPTLLDAHAVLGRGLVQAGKIADAVPHLEAAREIDHDGSIHYQLSRAYQAGGRTEDAKRALARYQELSKAAAVGTEGVDAQITAP